MKERANKVREEALQRLKSIDSMLIKIERDQIVLRSKPIDQNLLQYFTTDKIVGIIENLIYPIISTNKSMITSQDDCFIVNLSQT